MNRALGLSNVALVCDAHALVNGARPTLAIDVIPIGHRVHHAKVMLIHRENIIRLIIGSANLTHDGFRANRETAVVLDFHEGGRISPAVLKNAIDGWLGVLGDSVNRNLRKILEEAAIYTRRWSFSIDKREQLEVVFGGSKIPLWRRFIEAWPKGQQVRYWSICSPFWPQTDGNPSSNPFTKIAAELNNRGAHLDGCELEIIARASAAVDTALPCFPFQLIQQLKTKGFPIRRGKILAARLNTDEDEVPSGMAASNRDLHAKWIILSGQETVLAMVGSANFTRRGLGLSNTQNTNIEAGVLVKWHRKKWDPSVWRPPILGCQIDWANCAARQLEKPQQEDDEVIQWPDFIVSIEMKINWENPPDPDGKLIITLRSNPEFKLAVTGGKELQHIPIARSGLSKSVIFGLITATQVRSILVRRCVLVIWNGGCRTLFPVNIQQESKAGMPSILGAKPSEDDLLAYFHGRITEEDLLADLEQRALGSKENGQDLQKDAVHARQLQNYIIREFVESLYGISEILKNSDYSARAAEQAIFGDFSPISLAEQVLSALNSGRRSPTAAAFQLVELLKLLITLDWSSEKSIGTKSNSELASIQRRAINRLFSIIQAASAKQEFSDAILDRDFASFIRLTLKSGYAEKVIKLASDQKAQ
jgi:hypothetical protein